LDDFRIALANSYKLLKKGGTFRCIVPDLEFIARTYLQNLEKGNPLASIAFVKDTILGIEKRPRGFKGLVNSYYGNSHHLWMWDHQSLAEELKKAGFINIRPCSFHDSEDEMFKHVENQSRFINAVAIECKK
jgi:predicted SAM-dependent methyltransferase